jgi:hypothetical protein
LERYQLREAMMEDEKYGANAKTLHEINLFYIVCKSLLIRCHSFMTILVYRFAIVLQFLGQHMKVRQQVIATAIVYFKRFYTRNAFSLCDPLLVAPTCFYLATKIEECAMPLKLIIKEMDLVAKNFGFSNEFPYKIEAAIAI